MELKDSHQSQLEVASSSYQRAITNRDATIAALKDEADQLKLEHQESLEAWQKKCEDLQSQLGDSELQVKCQVRDFRHCQMDCFDTVLLCPIHSSS